MSRSTIPVLICDSEDGCGDYADDFYEQSASPVGGTRITQTERSPGWRSTTLEEDYCPEHAVLAEVRPTEKEQNR